MDLDHQTIRILGFEVGKGIIQIPKSKVDHIKTLKEPSTLKELQSFIGNLTYFRPLLPLPIHHSVNALYSQVKNFAWDENSSRHFHNIIHHLHRGACHVSANNSYNLQLLYTDASQSAMGAVLLGVDLSSTYPQPTYSDPITSPYWKAHFKGFNGGELFETDNYIQLFYAIATLLGTQLNLTNMDTFYQGLINNAMLNVDFAHYLTKDDNDSIGRNFSKFLSKLMTPKKCDLSNPEIFTFLTLSFSRVIKRSINLLSVISYKEKDYFSKAKIGITTVASETEINIKYDSNNSSYSLIFLNQNFLAKDKDTYLKTFIDIIPDQDSLVKHFYSLLKKNTPAYIQKRVHILGYYSKSVALTTLQKSAICYLELLAVHTALMHFEPYIKQVPTYCLIDNSIAVAVLGHKKIIDRKSKLDVLSQKISFWFQNMVKFMTIPGDQQLGDFLSRLVPTDQLQDVKFEEVKPDHKNDLFETYPLYPTPTSKENYVNKAAPKSPEIDPQDVMYSSLHPDSYALIKDQLVLDKYTFINMQIREEISPCVDPSKLKYHENRIILPTCLYSLTAVLLHSGHLHIGANRLYAKMKYLFFIKQKTLLKNLIGKICRTCLICMRNKPNNFPLIKGRSFSKYLYAKGQCVALDLLELPKTINRVGGLKGVMGLAVFFDLFTRFTTFYILRHLDSTDVLHAITTYIGQHGQVLRFSVDNDVKVKNWHSKGLLDQIGSVFLDSAPYRSAARGCIERRIRQYQDLVRIGSSNLEHVDFTLSIAAGAFALNTTNFPRSALCPYNLHYMSLYNYSANNTEPTSSLFSHEFLYKDTSLDERFAKSRSYLRKLIKETRENFAKETEAILKLKNRNRRPHQFKVGDFVLVLYPKSTLNYFKKNKPLYSIFVHRVIKIGKFLIRVENIVTHGTDHYSPQQLKKIHDEKDGLFRLPRAVKDYFQLLTVEDLEYFNLTEIERYKDKPVILPRLRNDLKQTRAELDDISSPDEEDYAVLMETIFEE